MSELAMHISDALIQESDFLDSQQFTDAVNACVDQKISDEVDKQFNELDISSSVLDDSNFYDAVLDIIKDQEIDNGYGKAIEDLQEQLDARNTLIETLAERLDNHNETIGRLLKTLIEVDGLREKLQKDVEFIKKSNQTLHFGPRVFIDHFIGWTFFKPGG